MEVWLEAPREEDAVIKAKKLVQTTITLEMDKEVAEQLDKWLLWAFVVWQQIQYHPMLQDEIFHSTEGTDKAPPTKELNHDKAILIRLALMRAEVEEI